MSGIGLSNNMEVNQTQTLNPQLLQSVTILQKTSLEIEVAIKEEVESNPMLELDDSLPEEERLESEEASGEETSENRESSEEYEDGSLDDTMSREMREVDGGEDYYIERLNEGLREGDAPYSDLSQAKDPDDEWERPIKDEGKSLQEQLRDQLSLWSGTKRLLEQLAECGCSEKRFRDLVEYLIDSIDENGFLQSAPADLDLGRENHESKDPYFDEVEDLLSGRIDVADISLPVHEALHVIHGFSPTGIGARNQQECFLIQANRMPGFPQLGIDILEKCYDDLLALRYAKIGKTLGVSAENVQKAVASFARLNPHPGFQLAKARVQTISADMKVFEKNGKYVSEAVRSSLRKRLHINETYKSIIKDKNASKQDKDYVKVHLAKAEAFMKALDSRYSTMELVMQAILKRQTEFFTKGPAFLKPMVLQDIAEDVKRDVSTVNRVTNGKFVDTPYGIFEIKKFFTSGIKQNAAGSADSDGSDEILGSAQVLDAMKKLIDEEDKKKPLSDQAISDKLSSMGMKVARRTVAKYREETLHILPARDRRVR